MIFWLISWLIYGVIVGFIAKSFHHMIRKNDQEPIGILSTIGVGVAGSYLGGFIHFLLRGHGSPFSSSGIIMGIVGAVVVLIVYGIVKNRAN